MRVGPAFEGRRAPPPGYLRFVTDGVRIEVEDDPTPMVLILAATLRKAVRTEKLADTLRSAKGAVALRSSTDAQAATIRFAGGRARVERGAAGDADVTITTD